MMLRAARPRVMVGDVNRRENKDTTFDSAYMGEATPLRTGVSLLAYRHVLSAWPP